MAKTNFMKLAVTLPAVLGLAYFIGVSPQALPAQDLTIHETTTGSGMMGQPPRKSEATVYMSRNAMKRVESDGAESIIRFDDGRIITINRRDKTYSEMTAADLQKMMDDAAASMNVNKEQMEMMRKMMGQVSDSVSVTKEGSCEKIAGYDTMKYHVTGMMDMELCAAPDLKMPAVYYDFMKLRAPANPLFDMRKVFDEFKKIDGMTLKSVMTVRMMNQEMKTTTLGDSVQKTAIDASIFDPPAGFKKVPPALPAQPTRPRK